MEDQQFIQIQQINRLVLSDTGFVLNANQKSDLMAIATAGTTQSGMAQTLLSRLDGTVIMPQVPDIGIPGLRESIIQHHLFRSKGLIASPNPVNRELTVQWQPGSRTYTSEYLLEIVHGTQGQLLVSRTLSGEEMLQLHTADWPNGLVLIMIRDAESRQILETARVIVQH